VSDKRDLPRVPVDLQVRLSFGSVDDFIERYAVNVSRGGVFVRTREPKPRGTEVNLDLQLADGADVIRGKGIVAWTTSPSAPGEPDQGPGMGIKFTELDTESQALVDLIVATRGAVAASDEPPTPAELGLVAASTPVPSAPTAVAAAAPPAPAASPKPAVPPPAKPAAPQAKAAPVPAAAPAQASQKPTAPATAVPPAPPPSATVASATVAPAKPPAAATKPAVPAQHPPPPAAAGAPAGKGPEAAKQGKIIGIDLGTTYSCVAIAEGGKARVLESKQGYRTVPSIIAYDAQGRLLVGQPARAQMVVNPRHTVYGAKRLVGRPFASPTVQACRDRFHYEIVEGEKGAAAVRFAGREFSLQQVSAFILKELREMASQALGEPVSRAIVTVPAYYNDHQRHAVREAGKLAGMEIERIVNEPTAAALAFGYGKGLDKRVLVYDLGGGTFDASILEIQGDVYEVVSTGGDTFLGGVDFDAQLVDHLAYGFYEANGFLPPADRVAWQRIRDAAEEAKIALSSREVVDVHVPFLCKGEGGRDCELQTKVSRAELETLTAGLVERSIEVCREVLAAKGLETKDVDEVLLVGGQSRMPLVWRRIKEVFGREPNHGVHPDEAVALGAALLADSATRVDSVVLIDVLAMGIGIGLPGGRMATVLPRNTRLPVKKSYEHGTTHDGQTRFELQVFQGDSQKVAECEYLGTLEVHGLKARPRGEVRIAVEFAVGNEGILDIAARDLTTGKVTEVRFATADTPEELRKKLELTEPQAAPRGARPIEAAKGDEKKGLFGRIFGQKR
jgi:molecular chaperone DnaK